MLVHAVKHVGDVPPREERVVDVEARKVRVQEERGFLYRRLTIGPDGHLWDARALSELAEQLGLTGSPSVVGQNDA